MPWSSIDGKVSPCPMSPALPSPPLLILRSSKWKQSGRGKEENLRLLKSSSSWLTEGSPGISFPRPFMSLRARDHWSCRGRAEEETFVKNYIEGNLIKMKNKIRKEACGRRGEGWNSGQMAHSSRAASDARSWKYWVEAHRCFLCLPQSRHGSWQSTGTWAQVGCNIWVAIHCYSIVANNHC